MSSGVEQQDRESPGRLSRAKGRLKERLLEEIEDRARSARERAEASREGPENPPGPEPQEQGQGTKRRRPWPWVGSAVTGAVVVGSSVVFGFFETALGAAAAYGAYKVQKFGSRSNGRPKS
jgi:hypothetical protein